MRSIAAIVLLLISATVRAITPVQVGDADLMELPDGSQLALDLSGPVSYQSFLLDNPPRLVVDLRNARLTPLSRHLNLRSADVRHVRTGVRSGVDLRIVLDLNGVMRSEIQTLNKGPGGRYRLVIDLFRKGGSAPAIQRANPPPVKLVSTSKSTAQPKPSSSAQFAVHRKSPQAPPAKPVVSRTAEMVIALDPGHGGKDPGAIGPAGTREKEVVMSIARRLQRLINRQSGMRAVLTRGSDRYLYLYDRIKIARKRGADLFISLHADAAPRAAARGSSVYILSSGRATSEAAKILADRENAADRIGGVRLVEEEDVNSVLIDMHQEASLESSLLLAEKVLGELSRLGRVHKSRVERASFAVLTSPEIPSILVETAFISNPAEERLLRSPSHQQKIAEAIMAGIRAYSRQRLPQHILAATRGAKPVPPLGRGFTMVSTPSP